MFEIEVICKVKSIDEEILFHFIIYYWTRVLYRLMIHFGKISHNYVKIWHVIENNNMKGRRVLRTPSRRFLPGG